MISHFYTDEEISSATGESVTFPEVNSSYFVGPFSDVEEVRAFANKLDALIFVKDLLQRRLEDLTEKQLREALHTDTGKIDASIDQIKKNKTDADTQKISKVLGKDSLFEIMAEGYWDDFVNASRSYWDRWATSYIELQSMHIYYENRDNEDVDVSDLIENDTQLDYIEYNLLDGDPPADIFDSDFVDGLLAIMPLE
jgi:hypothetical protein